MIIADKVREAKKFVEEPWNCPNTEFGEITIYDKNALEIYLQAVKGNNPEYPLNLNMILENDMVRKGPLEHSIIVEDECIFIIIVYSLNHTTLEIDNIIELTGEDEPEQYHEIFPEFANRVITL